MFDDIRIAKANLGVRWIKSDSGNTYLCPTGSLRSLRTASDEELRRICVEESANPQNN